MKQLFLLLIIYSWNKPLAYGQLLRIDSAGIEIDSIYTPPDTLPIYAEKAKKPVLYPNIASKAIMTPTGWGAYGRFVFGFVGGAIPQVYKNFGDMGAGLGFGFGNSLKTVGVVGIFNVNDVSSFDNYSGSVIVTRGISKANSIAIGALHIYANERKTDAGPSYYIAFSHADQKMRPLSEGYSRFNWTIGAGTGRFYSKSKADIATGKGEHGTAVFGSASYEVIKSLNINAEWTGVNLCFAAAWRPDPALPVINVGVTDLTNFSADGPRLVFALAYAYRFD